MTIVINPVSFHPPFTLNLLPHCLEVKSVWFAGFEGEGEVTVKEQVGASLESALSSLLICGVGELYSTSWVRV